MPVTATATSCATLVDEWARGGVRHAVVAPGSRSTPLALALAADGRLELHVHHDERAASFMALGIGMASGLPAVVVCTSGTAAAEFHAAIVEASLSCVPMIVCTADRPAELRHVGAPQTIDQDQLYGAAVRWYVDPGTAEEATAPLWRSLGARSVVEALGAMGRPAGPVHLNLPFRDPLVGEAGELPPGRDEDEPWHRHVACPAAVPDAFVDQFILLADGVNGIVVAGEGAGDPDDVHALAELMGWPVLADPLSGARRPSHCTVAAFDAILRLPEAVELFRPALVLRLGAAPASKVLAGFLASCGAEQVALDARGRWIDADRTARMVLPFGPAALRRALEPALISGRMVEAHPGWLATWRAAATAADGALAEALAATAPRASEPALARAVADALPDGATLVVASSMPVRDVEWFVAPRAGLRVLANRGANGIDGVVSTAVGVALGTGGPTAVLVGDVAFLHDSTALLGATGRAIDLTVVVVDNDGGGIFSFLPQAGALDHERFEQLFGTPHGVDPSALAAAHGVAVHDVDALHEVLATGKGVRLVRVRMEADRRANVAEHDRLNAAVAAAIEPVVRNPLRGEPDPG